MTLRARSNLTAARYQALLPTTPRLIILDLETTGLSPTTDFIIEIGALELVNLEAQRAFRRLAKPAKELTDNIVKLTGIQREMLSEQPPPAHAVKAFIEWIGPQEDVTLVGHNLAFDLSFLFAELHRINIPSEPPLTLPSATFCTYQFVRTAFYGRTLDLAHACKLFSLRLPSDCQRHRAVADCALTHQLLHALCHWDYFLDSSSLQTNARKPQTEAEHGERRLPW